MSAWLNFQAPPHCLAQRVILITGAGQGIGRVAALAYARHGATVILLGRNPKKLNQVYDSIVALQAAEPAAIAIDLAEMSDAACVDLAQTIATTFGRLDGILHCANGFTQLSPLVDQQLESWVSLFRCHVAAPFALTRACLPQLKQAADASILFIGESHALTPKAYWGGYSICKRGQLDFVQLAADEWEHYPSLRINAIIPGPIDSPFRRRTHPGGSIAPLPPSDALEPCLLYFMSSASRGISGSIIHWQSSAALAC